MARSGAFDRFFTIALSALLLLGAAGPPRSAGADNPPSLKEVIEQRTESDDESDEQEAVTDPSKTVVDALKRGTPRSSVAAYLVAGRRGEWDKAAQYLDFSQTPDFDPTTDGPSLARQFKLALDRELWVDLDALSSDPEGFSQTGDGLPKGRELVGRIRGAEKTYDILLQRGPREDGVMIWRFAPVTVADIPNLYAEFGYGAFGQYLPQALYDVDFLGYQLRVWVALLLLPVVCYAAAALVTWFVTLFLRNRKTTLASQLSRFATGPLRVVLAVAFFSALRRRSTVPLEMGALLEAIETVLLVVTITWMAMRVADVLWRMLNGRLIARGQRTAMGIVPRRERRSGSSWFFSRCWRFSTASAPTSPRCSRASVSAASRSRSPRRRLSKI